MELIELINKRCSVRDYNNKPVEKEKIAAVLDAARLAPSACNAQPWRFVVVEEPDIRNLFQEKCLGGIVSNSWASSAPVIIVGCAKLDLVTHRLGETFSGVNYHFIDLGIAMEHIALRATELGLGTCFIGWFNKKETKKLLDIPAGWDVIALMTLGYPKDDEVREKQRLALNEIVFYNKVK